MFVIDANYATLCKQMKYAAPLWQDVEAKLDSLLFLNVLDFPIWITVDNFHYSPVKPRKRELYIELACLFAPWLSIVHFVQLLENLELFILCVNSMLQVGFVLLIYSYQSLKDVWLL